MKTNIILIDDDETLAKEPLIIKLRQLYENVVLIHSAQEGIDYIKANLDQRNIVVLDYKFATDQVTGRDVLEAIRLASKLIPVIIWTANGGLLTEIADFVKFRAYAILKKSPYQDVLDKVAQADKELDSSLEGALEEWILIQDKRKLDEPYLITAKGKSYTLRDILREVREQTTIGQGLEKDLLMLTIDLLVRKKETMDPS